MIWALQLNAGNRQNCSGSVHQNIDFISILLIFLLLYNSNNHNHSEPLAFFCTKKKM